MKLNLKNSIISEKALFSSDFNMPFYRHTNNDLDFKAVISTGLSNKLEEYQPYMLFNTLDTILSYNLQRK